MPLLVSVYLILKEFISDSRKDRKNMRMGNELEHIQASRHCFFFFYKSHYFYIVVFLFEFLQGNSAFYDKLHMKS